MKGNTVSYFRYGVKLTGRRAKLIYRIDQDPFGRDRALKISRRCFHGASPCLGNLLVYKGLAVGCAIGHDGNPISGRVSRGHVE